MLRASAIPPDGDRAVGRANCSGQKRPFGRWFTLGQRYERRSGNSRDGLRDAPTRDMAVLASKAAGASHGSSARVAQATATSSSRGCACYLHREGGFPGDRGTARFTAARRSLPHRCSGCYVGFERGARLRNSERFAAKFAAYDRSRKASTSCTRQPCNR